MVDFVTTTLPHAGGWTRAAWNGSVFCAVALNSRTAAVSPTGAVWTPVTLPTASSFIGFGGIASDGVNFVGVQNTTSSTAYISADGVAWSPVTMPASTQWDGIAWNGSVYCAMGSGTISATSVDGVSWVARTAPTDTADHTQIFRSSFGFCLLPTIADTDRVYTSADGITWATQARPARDRFFLATDGSTNVVPIYGPNTAETSLDGVSWADAVLPSSASWYLVDWDGGQFLVVENVGDSAATSVDGTTWSPLTLPVAGGDWQVLASGGGSVILLQAGSTTALVSAAAPPTAFWTNRVRTTEIV